MGIVEKGKYLGKYKQDEVYYHHFSPEAIATGGKVVYVRIGDRDEELTSRNYILREVNEEEQKLIDGEL